MAALVSAVAYRTLVDLLSRQGQNPADLLRDAGLTRADLEAPDALIPASAGDALFQAAYLASGDPRLALRVGEAVPGGAFRVLDLMAMTAPTLGGALRRVVTYSRLLDPRLRLTVRESPRAARVLMEIEGGGGEPSIPAQEFTFAVLMNRGRELAAAPFAVLEVAFTFPAPVDVEAYRRQFGLLPTFQAPVASMTVARATWESPTKARDPELFALLEQHARGLSQTPRHEDALIRRVRALIAEELPEGRPTLALIAKRAGTGARTLQRRLEAAGLLYRALVESVRRERGVALVEGGRVSLNEVAWLVGFSSLSAFSRAFHRWTGVAPSARRCRSRLKR